MGGEVVESGLIVGAIGSILAALVQYWIHRVRVRSAERIKGLDLADTRQDRSLQAERHAFDYMGEALERSRKMEDELREDLETERRDHDQTREERDAAWRDLAAAHKERDAHQRATLEALESLAATTQTWQAERARYDVERKTREAEVEAARWREKHSIAWMRQAREMVFELRRRLRLHGEFDTTEPPPLPYWVEPDEE